MSSRDRKIQDCTIAPNQRLRGGKSGSGEEKDFRNLQIRTKKKKKKERDREIDRETERKEEREMLKKKKS